MWNPCGMMWNPCGMSWIPWWNDLESMWNDVESMWKVMDSMVERCGIHVECHGFHSGCVWNPCGNVWNPCGSMWNPWGNVWNGTIPPGIHLECGGRVNYCWYVGTCQCLMFWFWICRWLYLRTTFCFFLWGVFWCVVSECYESLVASFWIWVEGSVPIEPTVCRQIGFNSGARFITVLMTGRAQRL